MIHFLQETFKFIFDFLIVGIVFKLIIGHWIAQRLINWFTNLNARNMTIWRHYQLQAQGHGHHAHHVLECTDLNCTKL